MAFSNPNYNSPNQNDANILFETNVRSINPERNEVLCLNATQSALFLRTHSGVLISENRFSDLIGVKCISIRDTKENAHCEFLALSIISYPIYTGFFRGKYRYRTEIILKTEQTNELSHERDETELIYGWKKRIQDLYYAHNLSSYQYYDVEGDVEVVDPFRNRRILVVMNPVSGTGACHKIHKEQASLCSYLVVQIVIPDFA